MATPIPLLNLPELYDCVHCGLCLNACPTYRETRMEAESPRGRITLVHAAADGRTEVTSRWADHLYLCLMCRACESACPSDVEYGRIAERARALLGPHGSWLSRAAQKLAFTQLLPHPRRVRWAARLLRFAQRTSLLDDIGGLLPDGLRARQSLLPRVPDRFFPEGPTVFPAEGRRRARVGLLAGCAMGTLFSGVQNAVVRVLQRNGVEVVVPPEQTCCGALNLHNGERRAAAGMARRNARAFLALGVDAVVVTAAGCGASMKEYGHSVGADLEPFSELVRDASEFLCDLGLAAVPGPLPMRVTYQDPCHLAHGQGIRAQPRELLARIPGLTLVEMRDADHCCGSAGIYNVTQPEMALAILEKKMERIRETGAEAVVAPNPGCMLQVADGARRFGPAIDVYHLFDLLDRAYDARPQGRPAPAPVMA